MLKGANLFRKTNKQKTSKKQTNKQTNKQTKNNQPTNQQTNKPKKKKKTTTKKVWFARFVKLACYFDTVRLLCKLHS